MADQVEASHILLMHADSERSSATRSKDEAQTEITAIKAKLDEGADFAELAKAHSDDKGSAVNGGDLGAFGRRQMVPEFENAAFGLQAGQISQIIESRFGFHIIKVQEIIPAKQMAFEEVKDNIKTQLKQRQTQEDVRDYINGLRKAMNVKVMI